MIALRKLFDRLSDGLVVLINVCFVQVVVHDYFHVAYYSQLSHYLFKVTVYKIKPVASAHHDHRRPELLYLVVN